MSEKTLRFYQRDAIESTQFSWCEHRRTLGRLGTGSGKTVVAAGLAKELIGMGGRLLYLADQDELVLQPLRAMREFAGVIPAVEQSTQEASLNAQVVVASSQSMARRKRLERWPTNHFQHIIIDECHRGLERDLKICDYFENSKVLGLTATPYRKGLANLLKWFPDIAFDLPLKKRPGSQSQDLIELGFAPPLKLLHQAIQINLDSVHLEKGEFVAEELDTQIGPWYDEIAQVIKSVAQGYSIIAFLPLIKSSQEFVAILRAHGINARHVDGSSPDRREIIEGFAQGEFQVISNSDVLSTGVDIPKADCLLDLSPTTSMAKWEQRLGRVSRVLPGIIDDLPEENQAQERRARIARSAKPHALILDVIGSCEQMIRPTCLLAESPQEAREIDRLWAKLKTPQELEELARRFQAEKEAKLVAAMERAAAKRGRGLVHADLVGELLQLDYLKNWESTRVFDMVAASEPQLNFLQQLGVTRESVQDKGHASALIAALKRRSNEKKASLGQVILLRKLGLINPHLYDRKQASAAIDQRKKEKRAMRGMLR